MGERKSLFRDGLMQRARELAELGRYTAAPNPLVGAVVVCDGAVVGESWHARAGGEHAEAAALESSGSAARGAELYVTLEPCNHHGKTPPCTDAILRAGVRRVVAGHLDPNPKMRGRSVDLLREAGVEVEVLDEDLFEKQNEQFAHLMRTGRPFVHLKLATTLDGRIAASGGESQWVTGEEARMRAHELRAEAGAVLVGAGTARADDPLLTPRGLSEAPPPVTRVVLDPRLTLSIDSQLARTACTNPVVVFVAEDHEPDHAEELRALGVEVVPAPVANAVAADADLDLVFVLEELGRKGIRGVLVEGGGETAGRFVSRSLADKMTLFYAPKLLGREGVPLMGSLKVAGMDATPRFRIEEVEMLGEDVVVTLYPLEPKEGLVHRAH
ncbi:MAG: bifunctional diaminohydroxyphosphoribosylaminopyrimidine deaminase/5-amino-6-(5-phosphoribosylamino)uracil reductase RibD [Actinobacteria bacterium]|nr:bifunctional diaminohydroxyphosphoribosylaminopyrimidine deaminase/5-amino-6-(5-phosphoribosylamino)uracil reductase RibD [Actinomycetota bacterium]